MRWVFPIAAGLLLLSTAIGHAQTVNGIDQLLTQFQTVTAAWGPRLMALGYGTFGALALIDLVWCVGYRTILSRGDMSEFIQTLVHETVFLSFFLWVLTTFNVTGPLIIRGFQFAAQQAGGIPIQPNAVFAEGLKIASDITDQISILHPGDSVGLIICGLIVMGCFALITAAMVIVIVESYFIVSAGQILLMFGGSHFTADKAQALIWQVVGIGIKLYILQLIAAVGTAFIATWTAAGHPVTLQNTLLEIGQCIILLAITMFLPNRFERIIGVSSGGVGELAAAGGAVAMAGSTIARSVAKGVTSAVGAGAAVGSAGRLAGTQMAVRQAAGTAPATAAGRAAALIGATVANTASAAATDISRGLRGQRSNLGQPAWRMSSDLNERNRLAREENNLP